MPRHPEDAMMTIDELHKQGSEEEELGVCLRVCIVCMLCMSAYTCMLHGVYNCCQFSCGTIAVV